LNFGWNFGPRVPKIPARPLVPEEPAMPVYKLYCGKTRVPLVCLNCWPTASANHSSRLRDLGKVLPALSLSPCPCPPFVPVRQPNIQRDLETSWCRIRGSWRFFRSLSATNNQHEHGNWHSLLQRRAAISRGPTTQHAWFPEHIYRR